MAFFTYWSVPFELSLYKPAIHLCHPFICMTMIGIRDSFFLSLYLFIKNSSGHCEVVFFCIQFVGHLIKVVEILCV